MALKNTHFGAEEISHILAGKKNLFFDGIGGVSVSSLAHISHLRGYKVSGYDRSPSDLTRKLEQLGVKVYYEADEAHVYDCDALVYTVAMPETNPEYAYCVKNSIPVISRADFLGWLMTGYTHRIGVSGTHGKSTTTGMLARILECAGTDPTVLNGAAMKETGTMDIIGAHEYFAFEACEYMDSFLDFNPTVSIVLNIEMDHVDYFKSMEQMRTSYANFMRLTGEGGCAVIDLDDKNSVLAAEEYGGRYVTFSRGNLDADFCAVNESTKNGFPEFDIIEKGCDPIHVSLRVPGNHYISDATAAFGACRVTGIPAQACAEGLSKYEGLCRRMEKICVTDSGAEVYTDYAHHPTEIAATLAGAGKICRGKLRVVFQSHTYSRTAELFDNFVNAFASSPAYETIMCPIYPAREENTYGVYAEQMSEKLVNLGCRSITVGTFAEAADYADGNLENGDMLIIMGAGDVIKVADIFASRYTRENCKITL